MDQVTRSMQGLPLGRAAAPDNIADAVWFLVQGINLTTDQVVVVDGGRTM
jgi:hypothetical protein